MKHKKRPADLWFLKDWGWGEGDQIQVLVLQSARLAVLNKGEPRIVKITLNLSFALSPLSERKLLSSLRYLRFNFDGCNCFLD